MKFREIELRLDQTPPLFENEELALRFLLRRKLNKSVIFNLFRDCLTDETVGIERICRLFDQIAIQIKSGGLKNISETELCLHVFQPLIHEKLISYKTLSEFLLLVCRSLDRQNLEPSDVLVSLLISALVKSDQSILVEQLVLSKIIPITSANACALLSDPVTQQLGLDMLKVGGGTCEQIAEVMISNGDVIEALKWHKIENNYEFKCKKYLELALKLGDLIFRDVFRHFEEHNYRSVNTATNKQPPLVIDPQYRQLYHEKFGSADLESFLSLLSIK